MLYEAPFGHGRKFLNKANRIEDALLGGWQVSNIVTAQAGAPFSVQLSNPTANTGTFTRPNRVCNGNLSADKQSINEWYDITCFVNPALYTFGNRPDNHFLSGGEDSTLLLPNSRNPSRRCAVP